jgi:hypothetical protein
VEPQLIGCSPASNGIRHGRLPGEIASLKGNWKRALYKAATTGMFERPGQNGVLYGVAIPNLHKD